MPAQPPLGLYLHVPFCASACDFCAFYQEAPRRGDLEAYLDGVVREAALWAERLQGRPVATVFWGGGTPGLLPPADLRRLGDLLHEAYNLQELVEWTVEMAPATVKADKLRVLRDLGVDRISLGVQSFDERMLHALGRRHAASVSLKAWQAVRQAGFAKTNIDLMFALPGQDEATWLRDLSQAMALGPGHLSTYCLTFEEDTALYLQLARGQVQRDPETEADLYLRTWQTLAEKGYQQYEISNFARPRQASQHNINTWMMAEWIGLGPSAASQFGGFRHRNTPDLKAWLHQLHTGVPVREDLIALSPETLASDALIFGLRMNRGVVPAHIEQRFPGVSLAVCAPLWDDLCREGLLVRTGSRLALSGRGRLLADAVAGAVMECF